MSSASESPELWFVTGSQHLYGPEVLEQVRSNSEAVARALDADDAVPARVMFRRVVTTPDEVLRTLREANAAEACIGVVCWMHTFSPAKMWIRGLQELQKPLCHLHTQFNRDIPWSDIDMDFMNLNQSAHGGREFGHICTRMNIPRRVIVGHWEDSVVRHELGTWTRAALGRQELQGLRVVRFGDNMRQVAVTEGDKVDAEIKLGISVNTHGVGDLVEVIQEISDAEVDELCACYEDTYAMAACLRTGGDRSDALRAAARIELGLRHFLETGGYTAFTDTFEDLHGLAQLPGLPVQRLMAAGYGFGAEGDWKHAALVRAVKVMAAGLEGGTSFMEDYTYHFDPAGMRCLGAHMLEICPSIAADTPACEIHPLAIGGKADPVRLVFTGASGPAVNVSLVDLGDRFRMVLNEVNAVAPEQPLPNLPVARVLWEVMPDLKTGAAAWILAGGAHHTCYSRAVTAEHIEDLSELLGVELLIIDRHTTLRDFRQRLRDNR